MAPRADSLELSKLGLPSGGGFSSAFEVTVEPLIFSGQHYVVADGTTTARVEISRTMTGYALRLRCTAELHGPCMRCFDEAKTVAAVDAREVHQPSDGIDFEFVNGEFELDIQGWLRDSLVLELPTTIAPPLTDLGACAECDRTPAALGILENERQAEPAKDPRWAKLDELKLGDGQ